MHPQGAKAPTTNLADGSGGTVILLDAEGGKEHAQIAKIALLGDNSKQGNANPLPIGMVPQASPLSPT